MCFHIESHDWLGCWGHHMKSPGFKALGEHQKVSTCTWTTLDSTLRKSRFWLYFCVFVCPSWTIFQEHFKLGERTGCGGIYPRCKSASANKSSIFSPRPLFFLKTSSCSAKPGRKGAPNKNGSSNLYVQFIECNCMYRRSAGTSVSTHCNTQTAHYLPDLLSRDISIKNIHGTHSCRSFQFISWTKGN